MRTIFVQIKCELGASYAVAGRLVELDSVSEVYSTSGRYDLLIKCYLKDETDTGRFVSETIQTTAGVAGTYTLIAFNAFS